ncbi:MAG: nuclear transport factor 2 family protein [Hyphomicrobiaceae bacterium]
MATPFQALLERMTQAICRGDAEAAAACFTGNGVYHDGFYGEFRGRPAIADMVRRHFHGNAAGFSWTLSDVVAEGDRGYASYEFSYTAKMPGSEGRRAGFPGICRVRLKDGLIERYEEIFERAQVLARLGFADQRILKSVRKWAGA